MSNSIVKIYNMSGYHEYRPKQPNFLVEALWAHVTPFNAPIGGIHHLVPESTPNIAISRRFNDTGSTSFERVELFGPINQPFRFTLTPGHEMIAVRIKPEWLPCLLGVSADDILNYDVNLEEISPELSARLLSIFETRKSTPEMLFDMYSIIKNYAYEHMNRYKPPLYGAQAVEMIRRSGGTMRQKHLAKHLNVSERQLRRTVQNMISMSPKSLSRNIRFLKTLEYADQASNINWSDCAVNFGYFDQAHLINDFKAISNLTPSQLMSVRVAESVFSNPI
ncbi:MAG: AraC family transcriptional regulator [Kordiimonadaceae bacterium]|jgi:AraC-like DNA-binding protein|nr:AraC family transcriptional regulator [Kordiimonadaceae bacterium]MBT6035667.1 AraC family transcriptional regulator [Kordiimonadaceae bacterium]MBT6330716.1 AraC family transcriptional regulator [Kordiimonadaceae bacterium]MBT7583511.1 AraC family transcriptional regulator [Kordiimonadaceae bacterium]